jgi:hypothetical protein
MAANSTAARDSGKKMEFKRVAFDINEIAPDAPAGEWRASIPRGKCKVQPTKEHQLPMVIVPIRLDSTEEDGDSFQKALGTELTTFLVFGGSSPRGERMSKLRIREICEALDIDLDVIPKEISDRDDLDPFVRELEGKKLTVWTIVTKRKDTGEETTEVRFRDPKGSLKRADADDDDDSGDDAPESERVPAKKKPAAKSANGKSRR